MSRGIPQDDHAEKSLLGAMIFDNGCIGEAADLVGVESFRRADHATVYQAIMALDADGAGVDLTTLAGRLQDSGQFDRLGGFPFLTDIAESVPHAYMWRQYAERVREKALARRLLNTCEEALGRIDGNGALPVSDHIERLEQEVFALAHVRDQGQDAILLGPMMTEQWRQQQEKRSPGVDTGLIELTERLNGGFHPGELVIIAARPSMGKSALAQTIMLNVAVKFGRPVDYYSLEMSRRELAVRLWSARSGVDANRIYRNMLTPDEVGSIQAAIHEMIEAPIVVDATPTLSVTQLRSRARRHTAKHDTALIVVDYLQLMIHPGAESRQVEVSAISRGLKALARELNVPVLALAQLNREVEARTDHRPRLSNLRESGAIEQDADVVMLLHREDYYTEREKKIDEQNQKPIEMTNVANVIIAKQRNGPAGEVDLHWDGRTMTFSNAARPYQTNMDYAR